MTSKNVTLTYVRCHCYILVVTTSLRRNMPAETAGGCFVRVAILITADAV